MQNSESIFFFFNICPCSNIAEESRDEISLRLATTKTESALFREGVKQK